MAFNPPHFEFGSEDESNESQKIKCNYYLPINMTNIIKKSSDSFSLLSMNIRSCRKNFLSF